ncbi:MAG: hypothetical protein M1836_003414 [Candelina mexicana]|nr:MAG: hypothetical protein M1836_003414 [Candelina mexicana]
MRATVVLTQTLLYLVFLIFLIASVLRAPLAVMNTSNYSNISLLTFWDRQLYVRASGSSNPSGFGRGGSSSIGGSSSSPGSGSFTGSGGKDGSGITGGSSGSSTVCGSRGPAFTGGPSRVYDTEDGGIGGPLTAPEEVEASQWNAREPSNTAEYYTSPHNHPVSKSQLIFNP